MNFNGMDGMDSGMGGDVMFGIFPVIFLLMFALVFVIIIAGIIKGATQWNKNNQSPVLSVEATIVTKRTQVTNHHHNGMDGMNGHMQSSTYYYATFQVESKDRMELEVSGQEYGMLAEGDVGKLTFQGTRFVGFDMRTFLTGTLDS